MNPEINIFKKKISSTIWFKFFLISRLPLAFFAGIKMESFSGQGAIVSIRQRWANKNPFHSLYFAALSMAAEMSTGVLCMGAVYRRVPSFSMLVVRNQSVFHKKATGKIFFTCKDGEAIDKAIEQAILSGQSQVVTCYSCARNQLEETVAEFYFTWSFKQKK